MSTANPAFISYSREDSEFALRLAKDLKAAGAQVWLDQLDIKPGHPWDNAIEDALLDAAQMLIVLSPDSAKSENVRDEISYALHQGKTVIPVLYRDCLVPLRLQRTQRIDFRDDYTRGIVALLGSLGVTNPDQTVLATIASDEEKRRAAERAREAEGQRLRNLKEAEKTEEEQRLLREAEGLRAKQLEKEQQAEAEKLRLQRETETLEQQQAAETERLRLEHETETQRAKEQKEKEDAAERARLAKLLEDQKKKQWIPKPDPKPLPLPDPILPKIFAGVMLLVFVGCILWGGHALWAYLHRPKTPPSNLAGLTDQQLYTLGHPNYQISREALEKTLEPLPQQTAPSAGSTPQPAVTARTPPSTQQPAGTKAPPTISDRILLENLMNNKSYVVAYLVSISQCEAGSAEACRYEAYMLLYGLGPAKADQAKALTLFHTACDAKDAQACDFIGDIYARGLGVSIDRSEALTYYQMACGMKSSVGCSDYKKLSAN